MYHHKTNRSSSRQPDPQWLNELLERSGIHLPSNQLTLLWRYHQMLRSANDDRDLTRITGFENMVSKHYVDCILVLQKCQLPNRLLDIGSGPGLPGIPLKIAKPDCNIILAEPRPGRIEFLREVCKNLKLEGIGIFPHKVTSRSFSLPIDGTITRALEDLTKTLTRIQEILPPNARAIFMKGPAVDEELKELKKRPDIAEMYRLVADESYLLPILNHQRRLVIFEKV